MRNIVLATLLVSCLASDFSASAGEQPSSKQMKSWRAEGPVAVDRLVAQRKQLLDRLELVPVTDDDRDALVDQIEKINDVIDEVAAAKYSHISGLYWYTDETEARRQAIAQKKPILTLRLLGNLNEELTCANSRYFRVLLYPSSDVRMLLHDKFILHWKSVRPVPLITVDLGQGMKIERTISGNSVHYVMLPDGKVVDIFPGLYGPKLFTRRLERVLKVTDQVINLADPQTKIEAYRKQEIASLREGWETDLQKFHELVAQRPQPQSVDKVGVLPETYRDFWHTLGSFHPEFGEFDLVSKQLIKVEFLNAVRTRQAAHTGPSDLEVFLALGSTKGSSESKLLNMMQHCISTDLAADCVLNEYCGRYRALAWNDLLKKPVDELNQVVYSQLFSYPTDDPWLGIAFNFSALPKDGGLKYKPPKASLEDEFPSRKYRAD